VTRLDPYVEECRCSCASFLDSSGVQVAAAFGIAFGPGLQFGVEWQLMKKRGVLGLNRVLPLTRDRRRSSGRVAVVDDSPSAFAQAARRVAHESCALGI